MLQIQQFDDAAYRARKAKDSVAVARANARRISGNHGLRDDKNRSVDINGLSSMQKKQDGQADASCPVVKAAGAAHDAQLGRGNAILDSASDRPGTLQILIDSDFSSSPAAADAESAGMGLLNGISPMRHTVQPEQSQDNDHRNGDGGARASSPISLRDEVTPEAPQRSENTLDAATTGNLQVDTELEGTLPSQVVSALAKNPPDPGQSLSLDSEPGPGHSPGPVGTVSSESAISSEEESNIAAGQWEGEIVEEDALTYRISWADTNEPKGNASAEMKRVWEAKKAEMRARREKGESAPVARQRAAIVKERSRIEKAGLTAVRNRRRRNL